MENLTEPVYACSLGVEAHMICDLLARAGISARVGGEFLQGAGGELPVGNAVRVLVAPRDVTEARAVIGEWEKSMPPDPPPSPAPPRSAWRSPLWFIAGLGVGALAASFFSGKGFS